MTIKEPRKFSFGLEFDAPVPQSILPFITHSGSVKGFIPIALQEFVNPFTLVSVPEGTLTAVSVTLASPGKDRTGLRIEQYAAVVIPPEDEFTRPWLGYADIVLPDDSGYYSWYSLPTLGMVHHFGRGTLLNALNVGMDTTPVAYRTGASALPQDPNASPVAPDTMTWEATVNNDVLGGLTFFDFNWQTLFKAKVTKPEAWAAPYLTILSGPTSGEFKASLVQGTLVRAIDATKTSFDTIRVLKLKAPRKGSFMFYFRVQDLVDPTLSQDVLFTLVVE